MVCALVVSLLANLAILVWAVCALDEKDGKIGSLDWRLVEMKEERSEYRRLFKEYSRKYSGLQLSLKSLVAPDDTAKK